MIRTRSLVPIVSLTSLAFVGFGSGRNASAAELDWQAPANCPNRETVEHRIRDAIAMPLERAAQVHFSCSVTQRSGGSFRLELRVGRSEGASGASPRIIEAPSCEQVAETAAVAIALALSADAPSAPGDAESERSNADAPTSGTDVAATDQPKEAGDASVKVVSKSVTTLPPSNSHAWAAARLGPTFDLGSLPGISIGLQAAFELGYRAASARLSGSIWGDKQASLADGSGGKFSLWAAAVAACGSTARERAHSSLCVGVELGQMNGTGFGPLKVSKHGTAWWVTPKLDVEVLSSPWLFGLRNYIGATAGVPLSRRPFLLGGIEEVHRAESIVWRLNAGLEIDWH